MNPKVYTTYLSQHYQVKDLCVTNHTDLEAANLNCGLLYRKNLKRFANEILEPIRKLFKIYLSSIYRCPVLNSRVGGSKTSDHMEGEAGDLVPEKGAKALFDHIRGDKDFKCGQCILEYRWSVKRQKWSEWVHISLESPKHKREFLVYLYGKYREV